VSALKRAVESAVALPTRPIERVSLFRYAPLLVLLIVAAANLWQLTDPDLWGHVLYGQKTLEHHALLLTDPYSYSAPGHRWLNHEWLTEVLMALAYNHLGVFGLQLWKLGCVAATISFMVLALAETGAMPTVQLAAAMFAAVALMPQMQFRPQLFSFALFAALLAILARHHYRGSAPLWLAIPIMALWGNLHGGYIIGIATLSVYAAAVAAQDLMAGRGASRGLRMGLLAAAGTSATLLSPYGFGSWLEVLNALHLYAVRSVIGDWTPLIPAMTGAWSQFGPVGLVTYLCVLAMIAAFAVSCLLQPAGGDLPFVAIAATMTLAAFAAIRNMPLAVIASTLPAARHASLMIARRRERPQALPGSAPAARSGVNPWFAAAVAAALAIKGGMFSARITSNTPYPSNAIAFMKAHRLAGNVLVDFNWAQYFIWQAPESKVFIDGRDETVYPLKVLDQYVDFYFARRDATEVLRDYPHDFVLIPPKSKADGLMTKAPGWKLIYQDKDAALFARTSSPAAQPIARMADPPVTSVEPQARYFP
jgi:hypothetical protein